MSPKKPAATDEYSLSAQIEQFVGKFALLKTEDGQLINWPIKQLPDEAKIGSCVRLVLRTSGSEKIERERMAKTILNEILKTDD